MDIDRKKLSGMIDHTLLSAAATPFQIEKLCKEAVEYGFCSVCVNPSYVSLCAELLRDTDVKVCTVIGFPLGATSTAAKKFEAENAADDGAKEVDMVINIGRLKAKDYEYVKKDIESVTAAVRGRAAVKVIIEACLLSDEEKTAACKIAQKAGADFVKTSTGFSSGGAVVEDVRLMRETVGVDMGVKASGGIHSAKEALELIEAGASRLGASSGIEIVNGIG